MCDTSNVPKWNEKKRTTTRDFLLFGGAKVLILFQLCKKKYKTSCIIQKNIVPLRRFFIVQRWFVSIVISVCCGQGIYVRRL